MKFLQLCVLAYSAPINGEPNNNSLIYFAISALCVEMSKTENINQPNISFTFRNKMSAKIVTVNYIGTIENAEKIELAGVLGWQVVVKKDEFKVGDLGVYFSIGSILPSSNPVFAFLQDKPLKTRKIMGTISQGLLLPLSCFMFEEELQEGQDVTELLKVTKYIPKEEESVYQNGQPGKERKNTFPSYVPKTDEERVQNIPHILPSLQNVPVVITQKYDGTSTTFVYYCSSEQTEKREEFKICGRNFWLENRDKSTEHYFAIAERYGIKEGMEKLGKNLAIQGEIVGDKINNNRLKYPIKSIDFFVFNIYDIDNSKYLLWEEIVEICDILKLKTVPVVYQGLFKDEWTSVENLISLSNSQEYSPGVYAEGIVLKSNSSLFPRFSCKVISNNYLLKYNL